jgi:hypothetical protein
VVGFECSKREGVTDTLARELDVQVFELNPALAWRSLDPTEFPTALVLWLQRR